MDFKYAWMNMSGLEWVVGLLSIYISETGTSSRTAVLLVRS